MRYAVAMSSFLVVLTGMALAQSAMPEDSELLKTIFPWCESIVREQNFRVCTGPKYKVYLSGGPIEASLLQKDGGTEWFVAAVAFGQGDDIEHYYWYNQVLVAVIERRGGQSKLIFKTKLPNEGEYMSRVERVKTVQLNGKPTMMLEYRYSDSISNPRGWHVITKLFGLTDKHEPQELWSFETSFVRPSAASLPSENKTVEFHFVDFDGDGDDDIVTSSTVTRTNLWTKYKCENGGYVKFESNE